MENGCTNPKSCWLGPGTGAEFWNGKFCWIFDVSAGAWGSCFGCSTTILFAKNKFSGGKLPPIPWFWYCTGGNAPGNIGNGRVGAVACDRKLSTSHFLINLTMHSVSERVWRAFIIEFCVATRCSCAADALHGGEGRNVFLSRTPLP